MRLANMCQDIRTRQATFELNLDWPKDAPAMACFRFSYQNSWMLKGTSPLNYKKSSAISDPAFFRLKFLIAYSRPHLIRLGDTQIEC